MRKGDSVRNPRPKPRPRQDEVLRVISDGRAWQVRHIAAALGLSTPRTRGIMFDMVAAKRVHHLHISKSIILYSATPLDAIAALIVPDSEIAKPAPEPEYTGPRANSVFQWGQPKTQSPPDRQARQFWA